MKLPPALQLIVILLIFIGVSCASLKKNYLSARSYEGGNPDLSVILSETEKQILQRKADSLLLVVLERKKNNSHLRAREINQLYSIFGQQLNNDLYYNEVLQKSKINSDSLTPEQHRAALELLLSAKNYQCSYQKNRLVRRSFNRGDSGNNIPKGVLRRSSNYLYDPSIRKVLESSFLRYYNPKTDSLFNQLPKTSSCIALRKRIFRDNDQIHSCVYNSVYAGSYVVGNTIGLFHRSTNRKQNADALRSVLQPFDLVLMKSPHHLTDQFIPGYFGHVGIGLGSDQAAQLSEKAEKKDSIKGKAMVEALRSGTKISSLKDFADGDVFLIIRPKNLRPQLKAGIMANLQKQLNKYYDFNFDIESPEAITCTELVFLAYDFVDWKTRYTWSRVTISPDDLGLTALRDSLFKFPAFIENGTITLNPDSALLHSFLYESAKSNDY